MTELFPCDGCATRGHLYVATCERCEARMIARTPPTLLFALRAKCRAVWDQQKTARMKLMIREERDADERDGVPA